MVDVKSKEFYQMLWGSSLWEVLVQIANFRKGDTDLSKGKHIFADEESDEQEGAIVFYDKLREFIKKWSDNYGTETDGSKNNFTETYRIVFDETKEIKERSSTKEPKNSNQQFSKLEMDESRQPYQANLKSQMDESRQPYEPQQSIKNDESRAPYEIPLISGVNESRPPNQPQNLSKVNRSMEQSNIAQSKLAASIPILKMEPPSPPESIDLPLSKIQSGQFAPKIQSEFQQSPLSGNHKPDPHAYDSRYNHQGAAGLAGSSISRKSNDNGSVTSQQRRSSGQQPEKLQQQPYLDDVEPLAAQVESMRVSRVPSPDRPYRAQPVPKPNNSAKGLALGTPGYMASFDKIDDIRQPEKQALPRFSIHSSSSKMLPVASKDFLAREPLEQMIQGPGGPRISPPPLRLRPVDDDLDDPIESSRIAHQSAVEPPITIMKASPMPRISKSPENLSSIKSESEIEDKGSISNIVSNHDGVNYQPKKSRTLVPLKDDEICKLLRDVSFHII